jgi:HEXXH motif-containing protein
MTVGTSPFDLAAVEQINEGIRAYRLARDAKVRCAFRELAVELEPIENTGSFEIVHYALRHHALYEACRAAALDDRQRMNQAKAVAASGADSIRVACTESPAGGTLFLRKNQTQRRADSIYASDPYIMTALPRQAPEVPSVFRSAMEHLRRSWSQLFFAAAPGVAIILDERDRGEAHHSYTLSGLPSTIYLDLSGSPVRMRESILHETVHCWLNEALAAEKEQLPADVLVYSPWKGVERPIANFFHAVLAFGTLQRYFCDTAADAHTDPWDRSYCLTRSALELENLQAARRALNQRLSHLRSRRLRAVIGALLE